MAQAGERDDDAQGVEVGWGQDFTALEEGQCQDDGREVLIEIGLGLQPRRGIQCHGTAKRGRKVSGIVSKPKFVALD